MPLSYSPNKTADAFHLDRLHQIHGLVGPWGSGKSYAAIWDVLQYFARNPESDYLCVRESYSALNDTCVKQWCSTFGDYGRLIGGDANGPKEWVWRRGLKLEGAAKSITGRLLFRAAASAWEVQKFLSLEVGGVWVEEATPGFTADGQQSQGVPSELVMGLWARARQNKAERRMILTASPPPSEEHWFFTLFYLRKPLVDLKTIMGASGEVGLEQSGVQWADVLGKVQLWEFSRSENLGNLPEGYYESLMPFMKSPDQILRFYDGKVPRGVYSGWPVYPQFRDAVHVNPSLIAEPGPVVRGWDGGLTPACVWLQLPASGGVRCLAELQGQDVGLKQFAPQVIALGNELFGPRLYIDVADPAINQRSQNDATPGTRYLQDCGIVPRFGVQEPLKRIQSVRAWLSTLGLFQVHPRCKLVIAGLKGAYKRKLRQGVPLDEPDKQDPESLRHSHIMNALEYPATLFSGEAFAVTQEPLNPAMIDQLGRSRSAIINVHPNNRLTRRGAR